MFANPPKDLISAPQDPTLWSAVKWVYVFPVKDIQARLDRKHKIGAFKSARPAKMTRSGRILTMLITGSKGSVELPFAEADFILSAGTLRSNFFYIVPFGREGAPQELMFIGTDTGKGNGLCIDGATGMARAGKTAREILTYYYPDLTVTKEWKLQKPLL